MLSIAIKIIVCLILAALLGFVIGYLVAKMRKCDNKDEVVVYTKKTHNVVDNKKDDRTVDAKIIAVNNKPTVLAKENVVPDDLKRIKGIGVKIESALNDLGVYTYEQIASWNEENVQWVDDHLVFKGRIQREEWIAQAKKLVAGIETDFSKNYKNK